MLTGRAAPIYKEVISSGPIPGMRVERVMPGATVWPFNEPKASRTLELTATTGR